MKLVALALLAVLALAFIPLFHFQKADAITGYTGTIDRATFTSIKSTYWERVYTAENGKTYFVDIGSTGIKVVILNATGHTLSSNTYVIDEGCTAAEGSALSHIEDDTIRRVFYISDHTTADTFCLGNMNLDNGAFANQANVTMTSCGGSGIRDIGAIEATKNGLYIIVRGTAGTPDACFLTSTRTSTVTFRDSDPGNDGANVEFLTVRPRCAVAIEGAAVANDVLYCIWNQNTVETGGHLFQIAGTTIAPFADLSTTQPTEVHIDTTDETISYRAQYAATESTGTITIDTSSHSPDLFTTDWLTYSVQTENVNVTASTRSFSADVFYADSDESVGYIGTTGIQSQPGKASLPALTVSSGMIESFTTKYYQINDNLSVTGSGATWTPKYYQGTRIAPVLYTEQLLTPLAQNASFPGLQTIKIICDTSYSMNLAQELAVNSDADCTKWLIIDSTGETVGRQLVYDRDGDLVHADPFTGYTIHISAAGPTQYFLTTSYDGKDVDSGSFDSGGDLAQYLLFGQCYTMQIEESLSGNILQTGDICANDVNPKTVSLTGITLPDDWLGNIWSHSITRYFNASDPGAPATVNSTNNHVLFTVEKSIKPYNASINIRDHPDTAFDTFNVWHNFTSVNGAIVVNRTGIFTNQTLYFTVYENGVVVINDVSEGRLSPFNVDLASWADNYGLLFGVPIALIFPVLTAALFPRSQAHIGIIATGAVIGIEQYFGLLANVPFNQGLWAVSFGLIALGVMYAKR